MKKNITLSVILIFVWGFSVLAQSPGTGLPKNIEKSLKDLCLLTGQPDQADHLISMLINLRTEAKTPFTPKLAGITAHMDEMINKDWITSAWQYDERTLFIYDNNQLITDQYGFTWDGQWKNSLHGVFTYNAQNMPVTVLMKQWDETTSTWEDFIQAYYTYNPNNSPSEILMKIFMGTWIDAMKLIFTYNAQDLLVEVLTMELNFSTFQLENSSRSTFTYDTNGWEIGELIETCYTNTWINEEKSTSTNNTSGYRTEKVIQYWMSNAWEDAVRITYTYDAQWKTINEKEEQWNGTAWENAMLYSFTYDSQNRIHEELEQVWNVTAWENDEIDIWAYGLTIGVNDNTKSPVTVNLYPNPAAGNSTISFELKDATDINIRITDASGRIVAELKEPNLSAGIHNLPLPTYGLAPGYYLLSLGNSSGIMAKEKLIINR